MIPTSDFRNGAKLEIDGDPYSIVEFQHVKPGKGGAFVRTKLKNLKTGNLLERTFRSGEKFNEPDLVEREMQFLYAQGEEYHFMDADTYEQLFVTAQQLGGSKDFLKENMIMKILFYQGKPLTVDLPLFVELKIVETAPGIRGDTATGGTKSAKLESGATVKVPLYIEEGTIIKVDTRSGAYVERVK
ncbi:MAG TPA: elongation factor P [Candidatus Manganitrophaceae bacterium]|nr:elongation factor P [Candidatus Manganitrophaceae bacterium]